MVHGDAQGQWTAPVAIRTTALRERPGPANVYAVLFPQSVIWGCLGVLMAFGSSLVAERRRHLARLLMSPVPVRRLLEARAGLRAVASAGRQRADAVGGPFPVRGALLHLGLLALAIAGLSACFVGFCC